MGSFGEIQMEGLLPHTEEMRKMEGIIDNFERWNRNENGKTTK